MLFWRFLDRKELRSVKAFVFEKWIEARHDLFFGCAMKDPLAIGEFLFLFCILLYWEAQRRDRDLV